MADRRLVIDVREACRPHRTGKGQWTYGFVSELLRRKRALTLMTDCDVPTEWNAAETIRIPGAGVRWHWNVIRWLREHPGVMYVSPTSYIVPAFVPATVSCIPVIHDLIAFRGEPHNRKATWIERFTLPRLVKRCSRLCSISEATKQDLLKRFPDVDPKRISPIYAGPEHPHPELPVPDGRAVVCIATLCPRKNQLRLINAFAKLPEDLRARHPLILAGGRGWHDGEIVRAAASTAHVEWRGYVNAAGYESLLKTCAVFALPSLYEGFGMQILDALQRGIPVLTSDKGSLRELAEGAALIVDPLNVDSIAEGLKNLLTDDRLRSEFSAKGRQRAAVYSWRRTVDLFESLLS